MRFPKQDVIAMRCLSGCGVHGPGGIAPGRFDLVGVSLGLLEPLLHLPGVGQFVEAATEPCRELLAQGRTIDRFGLFGRDLLGGGALHELALDHVQRRQRVVACAERGHLRHDLEQPCQEPLELRRHRDQQGGLLQRGQRLGLLPAGAQLAQQVGLGSGQVGQETLIQREQSLPRVELRKRDAELEFH